MAPLRIQWLLSLAIAAVTVASPPSPAADGENPSPRGWVRVTHPWIPIHFELPSDTTVRVAPAFSLGRVRVRDGHRDDVLLFGRRPLGDGPRMRYALEVAFLWITPEVRGVSSERLARLFRDLGPEGAVPKFLRGALYADVPNLTLEEKGSIRVAARDARRISVTWRTLVGTPHEREVHGEVILLSVHTAAVLAVLGRFDEALTPDEKEAFTRIARSVELEGELPL